MSKNFNLTKDEVLSPEALSDVRDTYEVDIYDGLAEETGKLIEQVIASIPADFAGESLLAAGRRKPDPYAFTNIMARWYAAVRVLAEEKEISEELIQLVLESSTLPTDLVDEVYEIIRRARKAGWTVYRLKRHLSKLLIPKDSKGKFDSRSKYMGFIRRKARTLATGNFNRKVEEALVRHGIIYKKWWSRRDSKVRPTHHLAHGQVKQLRDRFVVGKSKLMFPGDPAGAYEEIVNCRCIIVGVESKATQARLFSMTASALGNTAYWSGIIGLEGITTGDGRHIEAGALQWDDRPVPLRWVAQDVGGHDGAFTVGRILSITRLEGGGIIAKGDFDLGSEEGREAYRLVSEEILTGVSMDLDAVSYEVLVAKSNVSDNSDENSDISDEFSDLDTDKYEVIESHSNEEMVQLITSAVIRGATLVSIPAFRDAYIESSKQRPYENYVENFAKNDEKFTKDFANSLQKLPEYVEQIEQYLEPMSEDRDVRVAMALQAINAWSYQGLVASAAPGGEELSDEIIANSVKALEEVKASVDENYDGSLETLVAAGGPLEPDASWLDNPGLPGPTAITVTEEGRVYGHLALWGTCHIAFSGECVTPPRSSSEYKYFHTGSLKLSNGSLRAVGQVTLGTGHATANASAASALAHYDNTGTAVADVCVGEDSYGIWVAGALRTNVSEELIREFRGAALSGDWRQVAGSLELVGALAVNVPGFPVPRTSGLVASGQVVSLIAAGIPSETDKKAVLTLSEGELAHLSRSASERRLETRTAVLEFASSRKRKAVSELAQTIRGGE